jgi:hypothetical protein
VSRSRTPSPRRAPSKPRPADHARSSRREHHHPRRRRGRDARTRHRRDRRVRHRPQHPQKLTQLGSTSTGPRRRQPPDDPRARRASRLLPAPRHGRLACPDVTLDIFETLWHEGTADWRRAAGGAPPQRADLRRVLALGGRVRLVRVPARAAVDRLSTQSRRRRRFRPDGESADPRRNYPAIATTTRRCSTSRADGRPITA